MYCDVTLLNMLIFHSSKDLHAKRPSTLSLDKNCCCKHCCCRHCSCQHCCCKHYHCQHWFCQHNFYCEGTNIAVLHIVHDIVNIVFVNIISNVSIAVHIFHDIVKMITQKKQR